MGCASVPRLEAQTTAGQVSARVVEARFARERDWVRVGAWGRMGPHDSPELHLSFSVRCAVGTQTVNDAQISWYVPITRWKEVPTVQVGTVRVYRRSCQVVWN